MKWIVLAVAAIPLTIAGCDEQSPNVLEPQFTHDGSSRCHAVAFNVTISTTDGSSFETTLSGDLQGEVDVVLTGVTWPPTGITNTSTFDYTFRITGGTVTDLIGRTFTTAVENRNILYFLLPSGPQTAANIGQHRATSGVQSADLSYVGRTTLGVPQVTDLDNQGVICL